MSGAPVIPVGKSLETDVFFDDDDSDAARGGFAVDDQQLVDGAVHAVSLEGAGVLQGKGVFFKTFHAVFEGRDDLLRTNDPDDFGGAGGIGGKLTASGGCDDGHAGFGEGVHAAEHVFGDSTEFVHFATLGLVVEQCQFGADGVVTTRLIDIFGDAQQAPRM